MFLRFRETLKNIKDAEIDSILDVGCGSGRYCAEFLKMDKTVTGIDIASEMLSLARELCKKEVPEGRVKFINGHYPGVDLGEKMSVIRSFAKKVLSLKLLEKVGVSLINFDMLKYVNHYLWIFKLFNIKINSVVLNH